MVTEFDGGVHAMGNGHLLLYGRGLDITATYAPYTSPNMLELRHTWGGAAVAPAVPTSSPKPAATSSGEARRDPLGVVPTQAHRQAGTTVWCHDLGADGAVREFVSPAAKLYARHYSLKRPLGLDLPAADRGRIACVLGGLPGFLLTADEFAPAYRYPYGETSCIFVALTGESAGGGWRETSSGLEADLLPGSASLVVVAGPTYPEVVRNAEEALGTSLEAHEQLAVGCLRSWFTPPLKGRDLPPQVSSLAEGVAVLLKAQQSADGGLMAGHVYPLAYVRDQYGASRGLLALGMLSEAKLNLAFRFGKWQHFGDLHNAESMGHHRARHVHENDDVESTGYTILQTMDYWRATGDDAFVAEVLPMLRWCLEAQIRHLVGGMLPFNGDETYVAGGFLPRSALNDGSMEATLLFIESGRQLLQWVAAHAAWPADAVSDYSAAIESAASLFRANFVRNGRLTVNCPQRAALHGGAPRFRHGVCEACSAFGWTGKSASGRYVCPKCAGRTDVGPATSPAAEVVSALLFPSFIGSELLPPREALLPVQEAAAVWAAKGYLPTNPGGTSFVGYDMGLLLYALTQAGDPRARGVCDAIVGMADSTQAYVEYYASGRPTGCRARPWESGVNICSILHNYGRDDRD